MEMPARFAVRRWTIDLKVVELDWLVPEMGVAVLRPAVEVEEEDHLLAILLDPVMGALK